MPPPLRSGKALAAAAVLLLGIGAGLALLLRRAPRDQPNIVLIVWDTCRGDRVSVNGYSHPTTPRLAELAAEGVAFRQCFTPAPWTPPAHASLFTGLLPRVHGLVEGRGDRIRQGIPLLPETLRDAGYETVCISANAVVSQVTGLVTGFEQELPCYRVEDGTVTGEAALERVRGWAARRREPGNPSRPFFLFVNLMDTHLPFTFESAAVAAVRGDAAVNGARRAAGTMGNWAARSVLFGISAIDPGSLRDLDAAYDGAVRVDDRLTGEILDLLRGEGLLTGAFVAVCGDHGEYLGEHGRLYHGFSVYEPVLRVPLVVSWPGFLGGGRTVDAQVRLQDLYPTILEAAGVPVPPSCGKDAESLAEEPLRPRILVSEFGPMPISLPALRSDYPLAPAKAFERVTCLFRAVREPSSTPGARKYISVTRTGEREERILVSEELYDLASDPGETRNLLAPGGPPGERAAADRLRAVGEAGK